MKLHSKWRQWCKNAGLRPHVSAGRRSYYNRNDKYWIYLKGKGHVWRVNCHGMFQCGDTYEEFDRWALCDIDEVFLPTDEKQFKECVAWMLRVK